VPSGEKHGSSLVRDPIVLLENVMRFFFTVAALMAFSVTRADEPAKKPNVVVILADDLGYECIAANGGKSYKTPHLDRLAQAGVRFEHCHVQPLCTPTRVQLMTGKYNVRNYLNFGTLVRTETTFAQQGRVGQAKRTHHTTIAHPNSRWWTPPCAGCHACRLGQACEAVVGCAPLTTNHQRPGHGQCEQCPPRLAC
jgi:hypothetical protein